MEFERAKKRIKKLRGEIRKHRYIYHVEDREVISDATYDSLIKELFKIEREHPELKTSDSPTQRVGGEPLDKFEKVEHVVDMLSLNDAFDEDEVKGWLERVENHLGYKLSEKNKDGFFCESKFDGLAVELVYKNGSLTQGSTRGDGKIGEDVTQNLKTIRSIPLKLRGDNLPETVVVRGEALITKENFEKINKEREKKGEKVYANPRNLAAGTIRQLDPKIVAERNLDFFAYDIASGFETETHDDQHEILSKLGFKQDPHSKKVDKLKDVFELRDHWVKNRKSLSYEIDGVVVRINNNKIYEEAGVVGKAPRGAIAYKFPPKEATTTVKDIKIQVGRTGALTPVAVLEPVSVGGVTIAHASLHNEDQIKRLGVKIGDTVVVSRSGDVIPQVTDVLKDMRDGDEQVFHMPKKCPIDGSEIIKDGAVHKCSNPRCGARNREQLYHFVSKGAFNIDGVGPKIIDKFLDEGMITDFSDLFELEEGDIAVLEGYGDKSAENIIREIKNSKKISLSKFLYSLGILHIGEETSRMLAETLKSVFSKRRTVHPKTVLKALKDLEIEDLEEIRDIGTEVAKSIYNWVRDDYNNKLIERLDEVGVLVEVPKTKRGSKLKDKIFVITGSLNSLSRNKAKEAVYNLGGTVTSSVTSKTDYLVVGDEPGGNKMSDAEEHNTKQINEETFLELVNQ